MGAERAEGKGLKDEHMLTMVTDTGGSSSPPPSWRSPEVATRSREPQSRKIQATMFRAYALSLQWLGREILIDASKLRDTRSRPLSRG